jgi:preprotein translocase subunit SecD
MKPIFQLLTFCLLAFGVSAAGSTKQSILQFRSVVENPTADSEQITFSNCDEKKLEKLEVQKMVLLDDTAIKSAQAKIDNGNWVIWITFTDNGTKRLAEVTRQHINKRLAVFIDGKLNSFPKIMTEISGGQIEITGSLFTPCNNFTERDAEELAQKINDAVEK